MIGTMRRLGRLFDPISAKAVLLAMDHGVSDGGKPGFSDFSEMIEGLDAIPLQGLVFNKGIARALVSRLGLDMKVLMNLSAGTKHAVPTYNQSLVCSVSEALRLGADAVFVHVNIGNDLEDRMLTDFGMIVDEAHALGVPVGVSLIARGGQIVNELDPALVAHCIRLGAELGADIVCVPYSGEKESFASALLDSPVPVLATGGPIQPGWEGFKSMIEEVMDAGASGVCVGRSVFQQKEPLKALAELCALVHSYGPTEEKE